jgi:hypothetical protein
LSSLDKDQEINREKKERKKNPQKCSAAHWFCASWVFLCVMVCFYRVFT